MDESNAEVIVDPVFGYRLALRHEQGVLRGEFWVDPGGGGKIEHVHPQIEERFDVLEGTITYRADGRRHTAHAGERFTVPSGTRHSFQNTGNTVAHLVVDMEPAERMEQLFRDAAALAREGKWRVVGRQGIPTTPAALLDLADFLERYGEIFIPSFPPRILQRLAIPRLARLGRARRSARAS